MNLGKRYLRGFCAESDKGLLCLQDRVVQRCLSGGKLSSGWVCTSCTAVKIRSVSGLICGHTDI